MDDINYGELFGIDEGGNEQEAAEPAAEEMEGTEVETDNEQGGNEQEAAEPAAEEIATEEDAQEQTPQERARYAAARRKAEAERDAAIEKAKQEAQAEAQKTIDEIFQSAGLTNPYTKQPITNKAEFDEYKKQFDEEKKARMIRKTGMTDTEFGEFVDGLPEVQEARALKEEAQKAKQAAQEEQVKLMVQEQMQLIRQIDPTIKDLSDITKMETYPRFYDLVKLGNSFVDAFKLANYDAISRSAAAGARQAAINAQGKQHLNTTKQRGAGAIPVPEDIKADYRALNPTATDAEIQAHYNKYYNRK